MKMTFSRHFYAYTSLGRVEMMACVFTFGEKKFDQIFGRRMSLLMTTIMMTLFYILTGTVFKRPRILFWVRSFRLLLIIV